MTNRTSFILGAVATIVVAFLVIAFVATEIEENREDDLRDKAARIIIERFGEGVKP